MKHVTYYNNTQKEALEYTSKVVDFGVSLLLYAALNELQTSNYQLRQSKYYKHEVKRRLNNVYKMRNDKVKELKNLVMYGDFAEAFWDAVVDASEEDISNFRRAVRDFLKERDFSDCDLYSQIETTRVLLEASKIQYEEVIKDASNRFLPKNLKGMKDLNLFDTFHEFYADAIYREWEAVCRPLYGVNGESIDLNNDAITEQFNIMADKFARGLYIDACLKATEHDFPEFAGANIKIED